MRSSEGMVVGQRNSLTHLTSFGCGCNHILYRFMEVFNLIDDGRTHGKDDGCYRTCVRSK